MTKYQKCFQEMMEENQKLFSEFKSVHDDYTQDSKKWQGKFNEEGEKVVAVIREWERRLCSYSEQGQYSKFSSSLADKFWGAVRNYFPKIDFVGIKS